MSGNPFNLAYPQLNSSDRTANLKSKTNYAAAVNLAKNGGVLTKRNGSKYAGSVHTTSTTVTSADSYADLLDVTKGKYLLAPPPSSGLDANGEIYLGGFMVTNYAIAKVPVTMMGFLNGITYPNKLLTTATIVVDPNLNLFYGLCNTRNYLKNVQLDTGISYAKSQALRLRGFHYPARVSLNPVDCVDCVTVKYIGPSLLAVPTFVYANPRGTGFEWFAVVNDTSKPAITDYAKNVSSGHFTNSYGNVVPFNNIVTTLVTNMSNLFQNASTFNQPLSSWDTSNVTNMKYMFSGASKFNQPLNSWNTANVTNMTYMFSSASTFNQPLNSWNTANVTNMSLMFYGASAFNGNITTWNTANVLDMYGMFYNATVFNQNISSWNVANVTNQRDFTNSALTPANNPFGILLDANGVTVKCVRSSIAIVPSFINANPRGTGFEWFAVVNNDSVAMITDYAKNLSSGLGRTYFTPPDQSAVPFNNIITTLVTNMSQMFYNASTFNEPIASWDTSKVLNMSLMFFGATAFNGNITTWNTANVLYMNNMFQNASTFNGNISAWNTTNVLYMNQMFQYATAFNGNITTWNTANVLYMYNMFNGASAFNGNITTWNTANVTTMNSMFFGASVFNGNIGSWNTANVTTMYNMFVGATAFNGNITTWNTAKVTNMHGMFYGASAFNQNITTWNTANVTTMNSMFFGASTFNGDISSWNTANVTDMVGVFYYASAFNGNIATWNTANVLHLFTFQTPIFI